MVGTQVRTPGVDVTRVKGAMRLLTPLSVLVDAASGRPYGFVSPAERRNGAGCGQGLK
jgi:hypothetical protein